MIRMCGWILFIDSRKRIQRDTAQCISISPTSLFNVNRIEIKVRVHLFFLICIGIVLSLCSTYRTYVDVIILYDWIYHRITKEIVVMSFFLKTQKLHYSI